jgi:Tol biopolymer transport system component
MSSDGLTLYFISGRAGGLGLKDVWMATRANTSINFGIPAPMGDLNSTDVESDLALSDDGLELFFTSDRSGTPQIWRSIRSCQGATP